MKKPRGFLPPAPWLSDRPVVPGKRGSLYPRRSSTFVAPPPCRALQAAVRLNWRISISVAFLPQKIAPRVHQLIGDAAAAWPLGARASFLLRVGNLSSDCRALKLLRECLRHRHARGIVIASRFGFSPPGTT